MINQDRRGMQMRRTAGLNEVVMGQKLRMVSVTRVGRFTTDQGPGALLPVRP